MCLPAPSWSAIRPASSVVPSRRMPHEGKVMANMLNYVSYSRPLTLVRDKSHSEVSEALGTVEFRRVLANERARTDRSEREFSLLLLEGDALLTNGVSDRIIDDLRGRI